ncbi:MAG: SDR family NAD(P)-dependent oxidoreductase [Pseudomonadota bacterium]
MQRTLVIGASRGIGLAACEALLAQGQQVRALARSAQTMTLAHEALEKRQGDALVSADVSAALDGVDAVVQCLGVPLNLRLLTGPITLFGAATDVLLPAMQAAGVRRLVAVTGFGAGDSGAAIHPLQRLGFNLVFGRAYADKSRQEALIKASELDWTIARPGVLTNGPPRDDYRVLIEPDSWRNGVISRASVADFIVTALADDAYVGAAPVLVN